ncbi:segregation and condensation protein A [Rothia sp. P6271]|uniref:segregation and condensation protein A n=1 Tax=Rothia sp. P6271 TaxID=3402659 RepID=UPI003AC8A51D
MTTEPVAAVMAPTPHTSDERTPTPFNLTLENFEGPFDLLLSLITRRKLDITDIALSEVTDEFIEYISALYQQHHRQALDTASDFLVTAATLLELKAARLLPQESTSENNYDAALLEARDLLFARLLQYRAYREVSEYLNARYEQESQHFTREVALEPHLAKVLPELVFNTGAEEFARIAAQALQLKKRETTGIPEPTVNTEHLQEPLTTIATEEQHVQELLQDREEASLLELLQDAGVYEIAIVRFLALLGLYQQGAITLHQEKPLGTIRVIAQQLHEGTTHKLVEQEQ